MTPFQAVANHITPQPTLIPGLTFFPSLEPHCSNDSDPPPFGSHAAMLEVSDCNLAIVGDVLSRLGEECRTIMEIGVHRNQERSITNILMTQKPSYCIYLGVDIDDKSYLDNPASKIHTIKSNSHDQLAIRQKLASIGATKIDLLMIDGWHSVNTCVNDWMYTDLLSPHGAVIIHDTNAHPGCVAILHAIDQSIYEVNRYCVNWTDNGIATIWKKR